MIDRPDQTVLRFVDCLDEGDYGQLVALMTSDAVWHRQGRTLRGRDEILAALHERSATQRIRHLVTNLLLRSETPTETAFTHYMTALRHDSGVAVQGPVAIAGPFRMSLVGTRLVLDGGRWLIAEQAIVAEFEFRPAGAAA